MDDLFDTFGGIAGDVWEAVEDTAGLVIEAVGGTGQTIIPGRKYDLVYGEDLKGIKCNTCGSTSWHPRDVREKYCGFCHKFHGSQN